MDPIQFQTELAVNQKTYATECAEIKRRYAGQVVDAAEDYEDALALLQQIQLPPAH